ncbi:MAG: PhnD/SsuA/transferrin family substrate-binding protein [Anaerolineae bacterium]|jgi:phosphonate transport system substrate-binding protein|nr:PhnD/SsuA/transferrin family substrate-binding protein [Anaerolineae bacterium]
MRAISYLAPQMFPVYKAICETIAKTLREPIELTQARFDPMDDPALPSDDFDFAFICGLPLARLIRTGVRLEALVAPVMDFSRYGDLSIYFADFIVPQHSTAHTLNDLFGKRLAVNDLNSNSGYHLPRHYLLNRGFMPDFFGEVVLTGAHSASIEWVAEGRADCAAIDSTVLDHTQRIAPDLARKIRVIGSTESCAVPPLAMNSRHYALRRWLQNALAKPDEKLRSIFKAAGIRRLAPTHNIFYRDLAKMLDFTNREGYTLAKQVVSPSLTP